MVTCYTLWHSGQVQQVPERPYISLDRRIFRAVCLSSSSIEDVLPLILSDQFWVPSPCTFEVALTVLYILWFHLVLLLGRGVRPPWDTAGFHYGHSFMMSNVESLSWAGSLLAPPSSWWLVSLTVAHCRLWRLLTTGEFLLCWSVRIE